jgi:hypothetical protein
MMGEWQTGGKGDWETECGRWKKGDGDYWRCGAMETAKWGEAKMKLIVETPQHWLKGPFLEIGA